MAMRPNSDHTGTNGINVNTPNRSRSGAATRNKATCERELNRPHQVSYETIREKQHLMRTGRPSQKSEPVHCNKMQNHTAIASVAKRSSATHDSSVALRPTCRNSVLRRAAIVLADDQRKIGRLPVFDFVTRFLWKCSLSSPRPCHSAGRTSQSFLLLPKCAPSSSSIKWLAASEVLKLRKK